MLVNLFINEYCSEGSSKGINNRKLKDDCQKASALNSRRLINSTRQNIETTRMINNIEVTADTNNYNTV